MKLKTVVAAMLTVLAAVVIASGCKPNVTAGSDSTAPAEVTNLQAVAGDGKISLSWTNPGDADLYQVEITASSAAGSLASPVYLSAEKGKTMSYSATGLTNGTAYTFTVKTIDKSRNKSTGVSTEKAITPSGSGDTAAPGKVTNVVVLPGSGKISLSWKNPGDADLNQVHIHVAKKADGTTIRSVYVDVKAGQDGDMIVDGLATDTEYIVTVTAIDKSGNKSAGETQSVKTKSAGSVMELALTQNPKGKTKDSVTITVTASNAIEKAKWEKGVHTADEIFASGTPITGNSFAVSENGTYSVVVVDAEGRREVETIRIENIDKDPPAAVANLTASYSSSNTKITVNWQNPPDSDFVGLTLSWKKGTENETPVALTKDKTSYEISPIETDGSTYTITVTAKDDVGNESSPEERTVTAITTAEIMSVGLNRSHLDTLMSNRDILVTITGSNFDKLTSLSVQVTDGSTSQPPVPATIDASNNKATATVQAPIPSDPTDEGTRYTVKAIVNSTAPASATASFIVSNPAKVHNIALTPAQLKLGSATKVSVAVTGTNFDIRGETKIKLFNSDEAEVTASTKIVPAGEGTATNFSAEITLPNVDGIYTVAVYFNEVKESKTSILQLYSAPEITSVSIPKAGKSYGGNKLPVTITGKNFTAPGIKAVSFSGTPALSDIEIVSDTIVTAKVDCPYSAGETNLTVTCTPAEGSPVQGSGKIIVEDYPAYTVGKIVLADKTVKSKDEYTAIDPTNPPVGIICGSNSYKAPQMIAVHTSGSNLEWAAYNTTGYNTKFEGIICTPSQTGSGAAQTATFTGDTDGSDNWEYIKQQDPAGAADAATNYPAFNWVNTYNTTYADKLGIAKPAWYMPSLAELCEVYKNRDAINASLAKICDLGSDYAVSSLDGDSRYWSSSQVSNNKDYAWDVYFSDGNMGNYLKAKYYRVCCLAGF